MKKLKKSPRKEPEINYEELKNILFSIMIPDCEEKIRYYKDLVVDLENFEIGDMTPKQALDRVIDVSHKMHIYFDQIKAIICMIIDHMESKAEKNETVIINQDQYDKMMYMMTEIQYIEHCIRIDSQLKIKI